MDRDDAGRVAVAWQRCPKCRHRFATLADEYGQHACPQCGAAPPEPCPYCGSTSDDPEEHARCGDGPDDD